MRLGEGLFLTEAMTLHFAISGRIEGTSRSLSLGFPKDSW
jgi:hypothetical protein